MSLPGPLALQQLHRLDRSSSQFHDQLLGILYGKGYKKCVQNLQDGDSIWLIDYLDMVCHHITPPHSPLTPAQALGVLDSSSPAFGKCLRDLRRICGPRGILPTSYTLSSDHLMIDTDPFLSGGFCDVYKGTLDGSTVCVKRMRVYIKDGPERAIKVCR